MQLIRTLSKAKPFFLVSAIWILISILSYSQLPQMLNSGLDNDHLIVIDHWRQILSGSLKPWELVFSRLPSLFPDYFITLALVLIFKPLNPADYLSSYWFVQFGLIVALLLLCIWKLACPARRVKALLAVSILSLALACLFPGFRFSLMMTGLPVNHGGNVFNTLLVLLLTLLALESRFNIRRTYFFLLFLFGSLAGFSNRIILIQLLLPVGASLFVMSSSYSRTRFLLPLATGSIFGGAILHKIVIHQCVDPSPAFGFDRLLAVKMGLQMLWSSGALVVLVCGIIGSTLLLFASKKIRQNIIFANVCLGTILCGFAIFLLIVPDSGSIYLRYLLAPIWIALIPCALVLSQISSSGYLLTGLGTLTFISFLSGWFRQYNGMNQPALDSRHQWASKALLRNISDNDAVLAVSPAWESRALALSLDRPGDVLTVSTDGNPMLWPHAREEYLLSRKFRYEPEVKDIRDFRFYLGAPDEQPSIYSNLGTQRRPVECFDDRHCLWILEGGTVSPHKRFFASYFSTQADDRWRCLNKESNPLRPLLHWLRKNL